ncbi:MAG: O-antigen ligase family protein [Betaproteobacteria bacterium]|nr:O-antigen ligase family protein [Betaproteobacteria bacterium]
MDILTGTADRIRKITHDTLVQIHVAGLLAITFASFFPPLFRVQEHVFFGLLALSVAVAWVQRRALWVRTAIDAPLLLLIGWILLTVPFAADPAYSFTEWRKLAAQGLVFYWVQFVRHNFKSQQMIRHVVLAVAVGTAVISVAALIMFLKEGGQLLDRTVTRAKAPFSDANWLATYLILGIPIVGSGLAMAGQRLWRIVLSGALGIAIAALYCSYMRAGWLALAVAGGAWAVIIRKRTLVQSVLGVSIGFLAILVGLYQFGFFTGIINLESVLIRLDVWSEGFRRLLAHPIVGGGYGQLAEQVTLNTNQGSGSQVYGLHSLFLMVTVGSGVPGLILLAWMFYRAGRGLYEKARAGVDRDQQVIATAGVLVVIGFAVRNMFDYMFAGSLAYLFWILLAVGLGSRSTEDSQTVREGRQTGGTT